MLRSRRFRWVLLLAAIGAVGSGCATRTRSDPAVALVGEAPAPAAVEVVAPAPAAEAVEAKPPVAATAPRRQPQPISPASVIDLPSQPAAPVGEARIWVESEPAGGVVVVDGRPLGAAPVAVSVPITTKGYLSRDVSVKVRFIAADVGGSQTAEVLLTPLDRVPSRLDFTPQGARRTLTKLN